MRTGRNAIGAGFLLVSGLVLTACGGSDPSGPGNSTYYLRFSVNGAQVSYTLQTSLQASFAQAGTQYNGVFVGFDATTNANLQVFSGSPITTTTYSGYGVVGMAVVGAIMGYQDATGTLYVSGNGATDAVVTITQLTGESVRGTFTARLEAPGNPDLVVTNGEFSVPRFN